ncbi:hypothetical protein like AT2G12400 [Hibiscus trionum]|nr:hypothetical protein like AT2G12400 [Hibiscus trionum]
MEETKQGNYSMILAENQTKRPDPSDNFRTYTGGWDITNQHYFASVSFSAMPFVVMAVIWFVLVGMFLLCACICCCCCQRKKPYGYSRSVYALSLVCLILFTITAIAGSSVMFTGEGRFLGSVEKFTDYLVDTGIGIYESLVRIQNLLISAKNIVLNKQYVPDEIKQEVDKANNMIDSIGTLPRLKAQDATNEINKFLKHVNTALVLLASIMLVLAFLGFFFSILGMQTCVYIFVIPGWIIITLTFIFCGLFLVFHNIVSDTCVAMDEWVQNPKANSALSNLIPCAEKEAGENIKEAGKAVTTTINEMLNQIVAISNQNTLNNQSGPLVPLVCDPYKYGDSQQSCGDQVPLNDAEEEWKKYVCQVSETGSCTTPGRLTPDLYNEMSNAVNVSDGLYESSHFIAALVDCTIIEDAFKNITQNHCPKLKVYSAWVYSGLVTATISVMFSMLFWVLYARERKHRKYTKSVNKGYDEAPLVGGKKL